MVRCDSRGPARRDVTSNLQARGNIDKPREAASLSHAHIFFSPTVCRGVPHRVVGSALHACVRMRVHMRR